MRDCSADRNKRMRHAFLRKTIALILALALVFAFTALAFAQGTAPASADGQQSGSSDSGEDASPEEQQAREQKIELYTMMGLIAMGAMYVGIREKNRRK